MTPLHLLRLASHEIVCRLARLREKRHFNPTPHLIASDIQLVLDGGGASNGAVRGSERSRPEWMEALKRWNLKGAEGLYWQGVLPQNYVNLIASEGKPREVTPYVAQKQITGDT